MQCFLVKPLLLQLIVFKMQNLINFKKIPFICTGWTMSGMPFSVLYMNPKPHMSVRSPISESLRSLPPNYENTDAPPPISDNQVDQDVPDIQAEALQARFTLDHPSPTILPTRKQYSIIPQLFVSYGWGPLGK